VTSLWGRPLHRSASEIELPHYSYSREWSDEEIPLTAEEQVIFWIKFGGYTAPLRDKLLSIVDTTKLVKNIRVVLRSQTTKMMRSNEYVFDGICTVYLGRLAVR
jgi:hypothetical protein